MQVMKAMREEPRFLRGPEVSPSGPLLGWIARQQESDGKPRVIRLPVSLALIRDGGAISSAHVGVADAPDALALELDDSSLGISLRERVHEKCPDTQRCDLWLEGYWRGPSSGGRFRFTIVAVRRAIPLEERSSATFAEVLIADEPELTALLDALGSNLPIEQKRAAADQIVAAGLAAIPVLIGALGDERTYERHDTVNRMNLPPHLPVPEPRYATSTVGDCCKDLLYRIITPRYASPYGGSFKVFSEQVLRVEDWPAWWVANERKSLAEIHHELEPLVDAYWQHHGTTQTVTVMTGVYPPARGESGFPIPPGARQNMALGGATSVGAGRDYTVSVYDVDLDLEGVAVFYEEHLVGATRAARGEEVEFSTSSGFVRLARLPDGTRITLAVGSR